MAGIKIIMANGKANLYTPFNKDFVAKVKNIGGRWNAAAKCWEVREEMVDAAREIMRQVYGADDGETETTSVRIKLHKDVSELRQGITILSKTIATAWGRDSGARVGDDVAFVAGAPISDGSAKNWHTTIPAGAEIVLNNVPVSLLVNPDLPDGAEIINGDDDRRATLLKRKEELERELAEINAQLNN